MLAVEPIADHWRSRVRALRTIAQSPTAYTSGRLVFWRSSTRMVPLNISSPEFCRKAVAGRMPMASTTTSAGSTPASVATPSALPLPVTPFSAVPVKMRMPLACSCRLMYPAISGSKMFGISCPAMSATVTFMPFASRFSATSRPMNPPPTTTARRPPLRSM